MANNERQTTEMKSIKLIVLLVNDKTIVLISVVAMTSCYLVLLKIRITPTQESAMKPTTKMGHKEFYSIQSILDR